MNKIKLSLCTILCLTNSSFAQSTNKLFEMSIEDLLNMKVVVASRESEAVSDAPSSVTVFSANEIDRMGISTLEELIGYVPSFQAANLGDRSSLTVRGTKSYAQVLLLIDGQRINETIFGGFLVTRPQITLHNAERVEVIRGPGSAIYGANAYLGVINIITKKEQSYMGTSIGEYEHKNVYGSFYKKVGNTKVTMFTEIYNENDFKYRKYQDQVGSGDGSVITPRDNFNVKESISRIDHQLRIENGSFSFLLNHGERMFNGTPSADGITYSKEHNYSNPSGSAATINYDLEIDSKQKIDFGLTYSTAIFKPYGYRGIRNGNEYYSGGMQKENRYRLTTDYTNHINANNSFKAGFEYIDEGHLIDKAVSNFDENGTYTGSTNDLGKVYPAPRVKISGLYIQSKNKFSEILNLTSSIRYDQHSIVGSNLNPRVALNSNYGNGNYTKFSYGEAFRFPTLGELYQDSIIVKGDEDLKSEKVKTFEFSYIRDFKKSRASITHFISHFEKQIDVIPINSIYTVENTDATRREGIEFEYLGKISENMDMRLTYSTVFDLERTSVVAPDHKGLGSLILNYKKNKFNLNVNGQFKEAFKDLEQDSLFIFNAKLEYHEEKDFKYFVNIKNIGNKEYLNTIFYRGNHITNRGREVSLGLKTYF